jgi:MFS family permease
MYTESDLETAVEAGVLSRPQVDGFRAHVAALRSTPAADEEQFRFLTGFNDIFVSIAIVLLLVAVGQIGQSIAPVLGGAAVAGAAWMLAEYFTARRRMALPSILLLAAFVGGVAGSIYSLMAPLLLNAEGVEAYQRTQGLIAAVAALVAAAAAWFHWRRFHVPITVAAGAASAVAVVLSLTMAIAPETRAAFWATLLICGVAVFALAMRWDLSDRERRTRRSDVAFWLHLAAAPMIAHPLFQLLGVFSGEIGGATAVLVLALYLAFAVLALAVDRRALLVSSLAYVLYALYALVRSSGAVELSAAITSLVIGSALLSLSAFWQPTRRLVVERLGDVGRRLPPIHA